MELKNKYAITQDSINKIKNEIINFKDVCTKYYNGELSVAEYKSLSGGFGTYSEREHKTSMFRLRIPCGELKKEYFNFILDQIEKYDIKKLHITTNQSIQLHNLKPEIISQLMLDSLNIGIVSRGSGGDFPRNVLCSPLSGVQKDEYFDVVPYAKVVSNYLLGLIGQVKLPRKLKVAFSNSPENVTHPTFRDMGFVANQNGTFDVYTAGGLGLNPAMGLKALENINPSDILYAVKAMVYMFTTYGNYQNRAKARTRYIPREIGEEKFLEEFRAKYDELKTSEDLSFEIKEELINKQGDNTEPKNDRNVIPQKQSGLYAVKYHPLCGNPDINTFKELYNFIKDIEDVKVRLSVKEEMYILNLTGDEANKVLEIINSDNAKTKLQESISCVGASICQHGIADSPALLESIVKMEKEEGFKDGILPAINISGCPSSCSAQQSGVIGFQGGKRKVDGELVSAFQISIAGNELFNQEKFGEAVGFIAETKIPEFFRELGTIVQESGLLFDDWYKNNSETLIELAKKYIIQ